MLGNKYLMAGSSKNVQVPQEIINSRRNPGAAFGTVANTLTYPGDIGTHFMLFRFREFSATRNNATAGTALRSGDSRDRYTSSVGLPVPLNMMEAFTAAYGQEALGIYGSAALDATSGISNYLRGAQGGNGGASREMLNQFAAQFNMEDGARDVAAAIANAAAQRRLRPELQTAVQQLTAQIINPTLVTAFYGVNLRNHTFSWMFAPESAAESRTLESIQRRFKFHMLPESTSRYFLKYPDEVDVTIGGASEEFQIPFKSCVIQHVSLDRAPTGRMVKLKGTGADAIMVLNISLLETEAFVRQDINNGSALVPGGGTTTGRVAGPN